MIRTIEIKARMTFDDVGLHEDPNAEYWFMNNVIYGDDLIVYCNGEVGDSVGTLKVLKHKFVGG